MPYFSIITCTYNAGKMLSECIASVEDQVCNDYEHIFVDGFSSDGTMSLIRDYEARRPGQVRYYQRKASGVTRAMNEGVEFSRGHVILHLHGDDRLAGTDVLQTVKVLFDQHNPTVVVGNCLLKGNQVLRQTWPENRIARLAYKALMPALMFHLNPIPHPSTYLCKAVFDRNGDFDEAYQVVMDYDFWFRILKTEKILTTDKILSIYQFHSDTISTRQKELGLREIDEIRTKYQSQYPCWFFLYTVVLRPVHWLGKMLHKITHLR